MFKVISYNKTKYGYDDVHTARNCATREEAEAIAKYNNEHYPRRKYIIVHESKMKAFKAEIARRNEVIRKAFTEETKKQIACSMSYKTNLFAECAKR